MKVVKTFSIDMEALQKLELLAKKERKRLSEMLDEILRTYLNGK
jgi:hypothetical protein